MRKADYEKRFILAARTQRWAVTMTKVAIRQALSRAPFPRWHFVSFTGPGGKESRGVVDLIAILIAVARYLAAHSPTERAALQTADIARRLMRGGDCIRRPGRHVRRRAAQVRSRMPICNPEGLGSGSELRGLRCEKIRSTTRSS